MMFGIFVMMLNAFVAGYAFAQWRDIGSDISFILFILNGIFAIIGVISLTSATVT